MSVSDLFSLYSVNYGNLGSSVVDGIVSQRFSKQTQYFMDEGDGSVNPKFIATGRQEASIAFTTQAIAKAIDAFSIAGFKIETDPLNFNFAAYSNLARRTASGSVAHRKLAVNSGLIIPRRISAQQDQIATVEWECFARYDGANDPIVPSAASALTGSPAGDELFTVGPVTINGTTIGGIKSIEIDFGIQLVTEFADGQTWPTFIAIQTERPVITVRTVDLSHVDDFDFAGTVQGATDSVVYLSALASGGGISGGTDHISITIDHGMIQTEEVGGDSPGVGEQVIVITPAYDGTNAIMVASTGASLP